MPQRKVLIVAYHFPPIQGSTGTMRTIGFSRYLRAYGWDVGVLTITPDAYVSTAEQNEQLIPGHAKVSRAWGVDSQRSLSIRGKYLRLTALPDRWQSWIAGAYIQGVRMIKSWQPDVLMTTYPIASAHVIGNLLRKKFRLPWVAEFRDPMLQTTFPSHKWERIAFARIEKAAFAHASQIVVTTAGCKRLYQDRFSETSAANISVIQNGYDPAIFSQVKPVVCSKASHFVLLHSGLLYPHERDPTAFFEAVQSLDRRNVFDRIHMEFRFRASGNEEDYSRTIERLGLTRLIRFLPALPYVKAVQEMMSVDGLMIFQAKTCNNQIPAKTYEYLRCRKPIVAFTDPMGDTGQLLQSVGVRSIGHLENSSNVERILEDFLTHLRLGTPFVVSEDDAHRYSRESLAGELSRVLERAATG